MPSSLSAITKMAAVVPTDVSTDKPQAEPLELNQWEQAQEDKGESADSTEKLLSDVDWGKISENSAIPYSLYLYEEEKLGYCISGSNT